jgi:hypothetical protein
MIPTINQTNIPSALRCRKYRYNYPDVSPVIYQIYPEISALGAYSVVNISGYNFSLDGPTGYSTVSFGDIKNIPVTFLSSMNLSFVVPVTGVVSGTSYDVQVVNNVYPTSLYSNTKSFLIS